MGSRVKGGWSWDRTLSPEERELVRLAAPLFSEATWTNGHQEPSKIAVEGTHTCKDKEGIYLIDLWLSRHGGHWSGHEFVDFLLDLRLALTQ